VVLLHVVVGLGIDGNGLGELALQGGDQVFLAAVEKLGDLWMDLYRKAVAHHIPGFGDQVPVDLVADGFA